MRKEQLSPKSPRLKMADRDDILQKNGLLHRSMVVSEIHYALIKNQRFFRRRAYFFGFSPSFFEFCAFCLWLLARKYVKIDVKKNAPSGQELFHKV